MSNNEREGPNGLPLYADKLGQVIDGRLSRMAVGAMVLFGIPAIGAFLSWSGSRVVDKIDDIGRSIIELKLAANTDAVRHQELEIWRVEVNKRIYELHEAMLKRQP